jgi:hypothetical protein
VVRRLARGDRVVALQRLDAELEMGSCLAAVSSRAPKGMRVVSLSGAETGRAGLSKRILEELSCGDAEDPDFVLEAWLQHLQDTQGSVLIWLSEAESLPVASARWLAEHIEARNGTLRCVLVAAEPGRGRSLEAFGRLQWLGSDEPELSSQARQALWPAREEYAPARNALAVGLALVLLVVMAALWTRPAADRGPTISVVAPAVPGVPLAEVGPSASPSEALHGVGLSEPGRALVDAALAGDSLNVDRVASQLDRSERDETVAALLSVLDQVDASGYEAILDVLDRLAPNRTNAALVERLLASQHADETEAQAVRRQARAAWGLGVVGDAGDVASLMEAFASQEREVRMAAARSVQQIRFRERGSSTVAAN